MAKIAIDCQTIINPLFGEGAGVAHYTYHLVWHLLRLSTEDEFLLFFDRKIGRNVVDKLIGSRGKVRVFYFPDHDYSHYLPGYYSHLLKSAFFARENPDLLHIPGGNIPLGYKGKVVLTVHDLAIFKHPEWFPFEPLSRYFLYPQSLKRASAFIVPSNQTASDLKEIFKISNKPIAVIYEGVQAKSKLFDQDIYSPEDIIDQEDLIKKYKIEFPYVFFLGTIEPRKNLEFLIRVFDLFSQKHPGKIRQLVLAGASGWKNENVFKAIEKANRRHQRKIINYLGYVPHEDKWALFENALAFLFPSLYEGFGLPPLEAMALGTPVISSNRASLKEVVDHGGILLDPDDYYGWLKALEMLLDQDFREKLIAQGKKQAQKFSWSRCAEQTLEFYYQVLEENKKQ